MTFDEYAAGAASTDINGETPDLTYCAIALAGEVGELLNKYKKFLRGDFKNDNPERAEAYLLEAGDILWYLARFCAPFGGLERAAQLNIKKLALRHERGKIKGEGDER